jgi:hypothetical protein
MHSHAARQRLARTNQDADSSVVQAREEGIPVLVHTVEQVERRAAVDTSGHTYCVAAAASTSASTGKHRT